MDRTTDRVAPRRAFLDALYRRCRPGSTSVLRQLHRRVFQSPRVARLLFATRVRNTEPPVYIFDLTTALLRGYLAARVRRNPDLRVLELGVGRFALPAGYLSRHTRGVIDAVDVNAECVASSRQVAAENGFGVRVFHSDLFAALPDARYDLIYWNLPYHREPTYLRRLLADAPRYLSADGELVLGYNAVALPRRELFALLSEQPALHVAVVRTWRWNRHEIMLLRRA